MKGIFEKLRAYFFVILTVAAACACLYRLMQIQIVEGDSYLIKSRTISVETQTIEASRGEITDINGNLLVSNKSCFNVCVDKAFFPDDNKEKNRIILKTAEMVTEGGKEFTDILPMSRTYPYKLTGEEEEISEMRKRAGVQSYASNDQIMEALCDNYGISDDYSYEEKRIIAGVRYTMDKRNFSVSNTYTFAEDISMDTVIKIKEASASLDGIEIVEAAVRSYGDGDVTPHLIGTVGAIDADEYAVLKEKGYALDDTVGKSGIELAMESTLRGKNGTKTYEMLNGSVISDSITEEATAGNSIMLTFDSNFQKNIQTILENHIVWLQNQTSSQRKGENADAGAVVVLNAKTGALLAAATAPTYNLNDYINNYSEVVSRPNSPLTNRALKGLYRPGSTFKTVTAVAALNEGIINDKTYITCDKIYTYWDDFRPECTGYHGSINVVSALRESCNIFFYETGRRTGIDLIRKYAEDFGLAGEAGLETGRDINIGRIACPETYEELGIDWQAGDVVQAAIGQSETAVTPLQLAALAMTIANDGTRYRTYMVDSVYTYDMETLVSKTEPVIQTIIQDKTGYTFELVKEGMKEAAAFSQYSYPLESDYYTGDYLLSELPEAAAIKTGTPQTTSKDKTNSVFIGFYPADDPEIAFAGVVENGEYSKLMIKQIISAYIDENYHIDSLADGDYHSETEIEPTETTVSETYYTENDTDYDAPVYSDYTEETEIPEDASSNVSETENTTGYSETETTAENTTEYSETETTAGYPEDELTEETKAPEIPPSEEIPETSPPDETEEESESETLSYIEMIISAARDNESATEKEPESENTG